MRNHHVFKHMKPNDKDFNTADAVQDAYHWIINDFAPYKCRLPSGSNQRETKCRCIGFLGEDENTPKAMYLAEYLIHYAKMKRDTRRELLYEWAKVARVVMAGDSRNNKTPFMLPGITVGEDEQHPMICRNALQQLLHVGRKQWDTAMKGPQIDKRLGKTGVDSSKGFSNIEIYHSLNLFFTELKQEALPFATRIIRDETGLSTRDDDPDDLVLPPISLSISALPNGVILADGLWRNCHLPNQSTSRYASLLPALSTMMTKSPSGPKALKAQGS